MRLSAESRYTDLLASRSGSELHIIHLRFMVASLSFGQLGDVLKQQIRNKII